VTRGLQLGELALDLGGPDDKPPTPSRPLSHRRILSSDT
jgi:hypothetical protein